MAPMFAGIDSLLGLLIFVIISLLAGWLQKKQRRGQEEEPEETPWPPPKRRSQGAPPPLPRPEQQPMSWEEELKRLLDGQPASPPPPPPPPVVVRSEPAYPTPPPLPEEFSESTYTAQRSPVEVSFKPLAGLTESPQAYEKAASLEEKVQQHLRDVTTHRVGTTQVARKPLSANAREAVALVRKPDSLRSAVLASIILGPPRSLSEF